MTEYRYFSCNDHLIEAPDTYTKRLPSRFKDVVPHIENIDGTDMWVAEGAPITAAVRTGSTIGTPRDAPRVDFRLKKATYENVRPGVWKAEERLKDYDQARVYGAILFPDFLPGFTGNPYWSLKDIDLRRACVKAYNDRLIEEFCTVDPNRFIPLCIFPVWSIQEAVEEVNRCAKIGYKGFCWGGLVDIYGYPWMGDPYWYPLWEAVQDNDMVMSLHQQSAAIDRIKIEPGVTPTNLNPAIGSSHLTSMIQPTQELLVSGILEAFPKMRVLIAEGGVGWIPFILQLGDRNFQPGDAMKRSRTEYFQRQCIAGFWRERVDGYVLDICGENTIAWEQDYPHPLSIWPECDESVEYSMGHVKEEPLRQNLLWGNVARHFKVDVKETFPAQVKATTGN